MLSIWMISGFYLRNKNKSISFSQLLFVENVFSARMIVTWVTWLQFVAYKQFFFICNEIIECHETNIFVCILKLHIKNFVHVLQRLRYHKKNKYSFNLHLQWKTKFFHMHIGIGNAIPTTHAIAPMMFNKMLEFASFSYFKKEDEPD